MPGLPTSILILRSTMASQLSGPWSWIGMSVLLVVLMQTWLRARARARRLPPGPTPLPIVGNILQMPRKDLGREFADLSNVYGTSTHAHDQNDQPN